MIWASYALTLVGALFIFLAALGAVRMPDLMTRMHATTKAAAFGAGLILVGVMLHFDDVGLRIRALAILLFITLTAPVAAHAIGHAGYKAGARLWSGTLKDDLRQQQERPEE
ncbi:MAG: monovalent cation/H(+) antiporter subunit G [Gammaproteobacteria bacterium]|jgi:multicomponent Na+:H+ antiporter subunit G